MTEKEQQLAEWLTGRPPIIHELAKRCPPWTWYWLTTDSKPYAALYHPYSYHEDGTLTVVRYGIGTGEAMWKVFGIKPDDLARSPTLDDLRASTDADELERLRLINLVTMASLEQRIAEWDAERN